MEPLRIAALCAACLTPVVLLRKKTPEQALLLTAAVLAVVLGRCLTLAAPVAEELRALFERAGVETAHVSILLRTLGAALVSRLCADLCKDGGSQALASAVETAGGIAVIIICMPLIRAVIELLLGIAS